MSLVVYIDREDIPEDVRLVKDVEREFISIKLTVNDYTKRIVREIENGDLLDGDAYIDRFGYKLRLSELSTGCKAALCVCSTGDVIDILECGINARDCILKTCTQGAILLHYNGVTVAGKDEVIDVQIEDTIYRTVADLNKKLMEV